MPNILEVEALCKTYGEDRFNTEQKFPRSDNKDSINCIPNYAQQSLRDIYIVITNFYIFFNARSDLLVWGFPHVEHFSPEREDSVAVSAHHAQTRHGQRLGRVSLRQDQSAAVGVLTTWL